MNKCYKFFAIFFIIYGCDVSYKVDKSSIRSKHVFDEGFIIEKLIVDSIYQGSKEDSIYFDGDGNLVEVKYPIVGLPFIFSVDTAIMLIPDEIKHSTAKAYSRVIYFNKPNPGYNWIFLNSSDIEMKSIFPMEFQMDNWYRIWNLLGQYHSYSKVIYIYVDKNDRFKCHAVDEHGPF